MAPKSFYQFIRWTVFLSVAALLCYQTGKSSTSSAPHRQLRGLQQDGSKQKEYYQESALDFIIKHGVYYRLFDLFFSSDPTVQPKLIQNPKVLNGSEPNMKPLNDDYKVRNHKNAKLYGVATAEPSPELASLNFTYTSVPCTEELNMWNNKYRYGPNINDRFMTIVFDRDPVDEATKDAPAYIYFVGVDTELPESHNYACQFAEPAAQSKVEITRHVRNVINRETPNSIIRCEVPWSISSALARNAPGVALDLVRLPAAPTEAAVNLLSNIHVPRLHALDRRVFKYTSHTMLDDLEDPMVTEWLVYNIMLGVEHFYFYYNAKTSVLDFERSRLKPFLDANLITVIYFPFLHTVHFMNVQHAALNAYLHQFSRYTEFVGLWDIDEFFMPTKTRVPYLNNQTYSAPVLEGVVMPLAGDPKVPAIIFNTLDMDCAAAAGDGAVHRGVTTHCNRTGFLFEEFYHSHGKMLVRPARVTYLMSPHRMNQHFVAWTDDWEGGMFRHFNQFRYTRQAIAGGQFAESKIGQDDSLREFTLSSLRELVGVTLKE